MVERRGWARYAKVILMHLAKGFVDVLRINTAPIVVNNCRVIYELQVYNKLKL
jgi:hypothetical protein